MMLLFIVNEHDIVAVSMLQNFTSYLWTHSYHCPTRFLAYQIRIARNGHSSYINLWRRNILNFKISKIRTKSLKWLIYFIDVAQFLHLFLTINASHWARHFAYEIGRFPQKYSIDLCDLKPRASSQKELTQSASFSHYAIHITFSSFIYVICFVSYFPHAFDCYPIIEFSVILHICGKKQKYDGIEHNEW